MSPLWPETRQIFFGTEAVHGVSRRGWRRRAGAAGCHPVAASGGEPWCDGLAAFTSALGEGRGQGVRVVLSNHLVQYRVLPWRDDLESPEEYQVMAQLYFTETFGALADGWTIALSDEPPGAPRVAAAVPAGLLAGLEAAVQAAGCKLHSVQPYFTVAFNAWRHCLPPGQGRWLLVHEPGRLCFALLEQGRWRWLRHQRVAADWQQRLPELLEEESLLAGAGEAAATVLLFTPDAAGALPTGTAAGIEFVGIPGDGGFAARDEGALAAAWLA